METIVNVSSNVVWVEKDKDDVSTYSFDVAGLTPAGASLSTADWSVANGTVEIHASEVRGAKTLVQVGSGAQGTWSALRCRLGFVGGDSTDFVVQVFVRQDAEAIPTLGSALFPNRFAAIAALRRDNLMLAAAGALPSVQLSDDLIWEKLLAAESAIAGMLHAPLQPTRFFPQQPTTEQIAALPPGMPWAIDEPYDYDPANYRGDRWGFIVTRQRPIIEVNKTRFVYPAPQHVVLEVPSDWVRMDRKYGHLQFVPTSSPFLSPIGGLVMNSMAAGRQLPFAVEVEYTAGLSDVQRKFPELLSVVKKQAVAYLIEDAFLPSSGSISADGLSQSMTVDLANYHDSIDRAINGVDGSNGGLMVKIHGIRMMVI